MSDLDERLIEHARGRGSVGGYFTPALVILFTIFWSLAIYALIGSRSRDWEYGAVPYVPAESAFTTQSYPSGTAPKQVVLPMTGGERDRD